MVVVLVHNSQTARHLNTKNGSRLFSSDASSASLEGTASSMEAWKQTSCFDNDMQKTLTEREKWIKKDIQHIKYQKLEKHLMQDSTAKFQLIT